MPHAWLVPCGWLWLLGDRLLMFMRVAVIGLTGPRAGSHQAVMDAMHFEDSLWPRWILGFEETITSHDQIILCWTIDSDAFLSKYYVIFLTSFAQS